MRCLFAIWTFLIKTTHESWNVNSVYSSVLFQTEHLCSIWYWYRLRPIFIKAFFFFSGKVNKTVTWVQFSCYYINLCPRAQSKIYKEMACRGRSGLACTEPWPQPIQRLWLNWNTSSESDPNHPTSEAKLDRSHVLISWESVQKSGGFSCSRVYSSDVHILLSTSCLLVFY